MIYILIPLTVGLIMLPLATGGDPIRAYGHAVAALIILAGIYAGIHAITP
jgi:hypothetical protein